MDDDFWHLKQYASTGSQQSFARIVARYADMVYSTCLRWLGNREAAEDAAQAVFVALRGRPAPSSLELSSAGGSIARHDMRPPWRCADFNAKEN